MPSSILQDDAGKDIEIQKTNESIAVNFPIVGIGASAGGMAAFEAFFSGMFGWKRQED
jgi:two-component system CheB/CheR fusion protein